MGDAGARRAADDRAPPHRVLLVTQQAGALAVEHDEELLLGAVAVGRTVELVRLDDEVDETCVHGPRRAPEITVDAAILILVERDRGDVS